MDGFFTRIADIIKKGKISTRMKFMLLDVQDLRKNDWAPRRHQVTTIKTIDQVSVLVLDIYILSPNLKCTQ